MAGPGRSGRPILVRIPFSHYCRKAEWGLTQAGIPYDTWDVLPHGVLRMSDVTPDGTVPIMVDHDRMVDGSGAILVWASERAVEGTPPLYPEEALDAVRAWEMWADEDVGPVARREAYRVAYHTPRRFTRKPHLWLLAWLLHRPILAVLKYVRARRFDDTDQAAVTAMVGRVSERLNHTGTGYLLGPQPTAADIAVASLMEPLLYAVPGRDYAQLAGWVDVEAFISRMRPKRTLRRRSRWMRTRHWMHLEELGRNERAKRKGAGNGKGKGKGKAKRSQASGPTR